MDEYDYEHEEASEQRWRYSKLWDWFFTALALAALAYLIYWSMKEP